MQSMLVTNATALQKYRKMPFEQNWNRNETRVHDNMYADFMTFQACYCGKRGPDCVFMVCEQNCYACTYCKDSRFASIDWDNKDRHGNVICGCCLPDGTSCRAALVVTKESAGFPRSLLLTNMARSAKDNYMQYCKFGDEAYSRHTTGTLERKVQLAKIEAKSEGKAAGRLELLQEQDETKKRAREQAAAVADTKRNFFLATYNVGTLGEMPKEQREGAKKAWYDHCAPRREKKQKKEMDARRIADYDAVEFNRDELFEALQTANNDLRAAGLETVGADIVRWGHPASGDAAAESDDGADE